MTIEEAKKDIPDFDSFCRQACLRCNNDWYCPDYCDLLEKVERMDFNRILECYARNDGEMYKVLRLLCEKIAKNRTQDISGGELYEIYLR